MLKNLKILRVMKIMDKFVAELKRILLFKDTTVEGDIVILASNEPRMIAYALVTRIEPDSNKKGSWWNVSMHVLSIPPREVVWTLREPQFSGQEIFTFGGIEHFMKAVQLDSTSPAADSKDGRSTTTGTPKKKKLHIVK